MSNDLAGLAERISRATPPIPPNVITYDNCAEYAAQRILAAAVRDPIAFASAIEAYRKNPYGKDIENLLTEEDIQFIIEGRYGVTGFQWGWAVSAVLALLEQKAAPNPAIVQLKKHD